MAPPHEVTIAIERALGVKAQFSPFTSGTNRRTYLVRSAEQHWVARIEPAPAISFQRAIMAQARAYAAGVRTPVTIAHDQIPTEQGPYLWSVETFVAGVSFDHDQTESPQAQDAIRDLGRQLRLLHAVEVDAFGDLPPRPYPVYPSFSAWVQNKAKRIARAVALAGGEPSTIPLIEQIYALLATAYTAGPRLCKGDCAADNLLVDHTHAVTIIDWEWAQGLDPAADIAFWCSYTEQVQAHELLLAAYEPDDLALFCRRVEAHRVVNSIETIHVFDEHRHAYDATEREAGIRTEWEALRQRVWSVLI
ncbi:MAG: aminoglycoside phosphotransferase family protein [Roseiflexaceae bacterium]|nr:aminoglycoside phosphotransferase family protein [Roseiflexaceae bacterium]